MTPSTKPVTRLTSAWAFDGGSRQIVATIHGSLIELRLKGRRQTEVLDISSLYFRAINERIAKARADKRKAKAAKKGNRK